MATFGASATRRLSEARYELTSRRGITNALLLAGLPLMLVVLGGVGIQLFAPELSTPAATMQLRRENSRLHEEVERARAELQVERATRAELDRQVAELNETVKQLNTQLDFFESHSGGSRKAD